MYELIFQTVFGILAENIKDYDEQEHFKEWLDFERDKL